MKRFLIVALGLALRVAGCAGARTGKAIRAYLDTYPEARVQDIYKSFCQDNLGPGHLIPDPEAARSYLRAELEEYRADVARGAYAIPERRYGAVGDQGNFVLVDLSVVLDSLVTEQELLDAFVRSATAPTIVLPEQWVAKWQAVEAVIRRGFMDIPGAAEDLAHIDALVAEGNLILHHSEAFSAAYNPHYRIVARDIFQQEVLPKL